MGTQLNIKQFIESDCVTSENYDPNELIFKEGEKIKGIYYIEEGQIKISRKGRNNIAVWFAHPKEFIGLCSFFNNSKNYSFNASAFCGKAKIIFIPTADFKKILVDNAAFKAEIIQELCNRISFTRKRVSNMKSQNIRERFLNALMMLVDINGSKGSSVNIYYSIKELSELAGTSKQYIKKLVSEFQQKKLLIVKGDSLTVNLDQLNSLHL